jgi:ABC-2 type transport system permease protein
MIGDILKLQKLGWFQNRNRFMELLRERPLTVILLGGALTAFYVGYLALLMLIVRVVFQDEDFGVILAANLLKILLFITIGISLMSSLNTAISNFYLSKDLEFQFCLPVRFNALVLNRYLSVYWQSSWMLVLFGMPFVIFYLLHEQAPFLYIILGSLGFIMLSTLPVTASIIACIILVRIFPAKRMHQIFMVVSLVLAAVVVFLFRYVEPEQFIGPGGIEKFRGYVDLVELDQPWNPAIWTSNMITAWTQREYAASVPHGLRLLFTYLASMGIYLFVAHKLYRSSWDRALQSLSGEGETVTDQKVTGISRLLANPKWGQEAREIILFFRDPAQWSQIFVLGALMILYLYSLTKLPVDPYGQNLYTLAMGNTLFVAFIALSISSRFVFTSFSQDGQAIWLMKTAPGGWDRFVRSKFTVFGIPAIVFSLMLNVLSGVLLNLEIGQMVTLTIHSLWDAAFLVLLSLALGMLYINPGVENPLKLMVSPGGFILMVAGMVTVFTHTILRIMEASRHLNRRLELENLPTLNSGIMIPVYLVLAAIEFALVFYLLRRGIRYLKAGDYL